VGVVVLSPGISIDDAGYEVRRIWRYNACSHTEVSSLGGTHMITDQKIAQAYSDLRETCGGLKDDYFGLLYLEQEHNVPREKALNQMAFGGHDYGLDGFHFDEQKRNLYLYQFKNSPSFGQFKQSLQRLIDSGMERVFVAPNKDDAKNQLLLQLRACLKENRAIIDQIFFRFVFTGNPKDAEASPVLDKLCEDLENKKYLIDQFFGDRQVHFVIEFRSAIGRIGEPREPTSTPFDVSLTDPAVVHGPSGEKMYLGFIRLSDLHRIYRGLGSRFFDRNIRYGLGESEAVNRAISAALKKIVLEKSEQPSSFAFDHNGITLFAEHVELLDGSYQLTAPRLLNGAQTVTTVDSFLRKNDNNPKLKDGADSFQSIRALCKVITEADSKFVTRVTINNNRQNPVEAWNLHANDLIQLELQEKLALELGIFYERQENAFDQLAAEDLADYGISEDAKAIQMLKLTQTLLLTDGSISRLSKMPNVFEDQAVYDQVFRDARLKADSRHIVLCYKIQFNLRKYANDIEQKGQNKYWFMSRSRYLLWALLCQGVLNHDKLEKLAQEHGTSLVVAFGYKELITSLALSKVRLLLSELMQDKEYGDRVAEGKLDFLRNDKAFEKCMELAYRKWRWVHKKLG
jgi:hypothetical protein